MIEQIWVRNFRCFEDVSINFVDRPSCLIIGKNGSGKSTLRHVLAILQQLSRSPRRTREWVRLADFTEIGFDHPMRFGIEAVVEQKRFRYEIELRWPEDGTEAKITEEVLKIDDFPAFIRNPLGLVTGDSRLGLDGHIAAFSVVGDRQGDNSIQEFKSFLDSMILVAPAPNRMSGYSKAEDSDLAQDASNIGSWLSRQLKRAPTARAMIDSYLAGVFLDFHAFDFKSVGRDEQQLFVTFKDEGGPRSRAIDFADLSDGEKCFFLAAAILAANRTSGPIMCFWDEPDSHLSLSEVHHFIVHLRRMTNQNGQLIATSHSPKTIRSFSDENTLVFTRDSHLSTTVVRSLDEFSYRGDLIEALAREEIIG